MAYAENILMSATQKISCPWIRRVQIILRSKYADTDNKGIQLIIGDNQYGQQESVLEFGDSVIGVTQQDKISNGENYWISLQGSKYLALAKDKGTITIKNMSYEDIALIMAAQLYRIEIKVGYKTTGDLITIAKGEVSYISQKIHKGYDVDTYITFASEWVAGWSQSRINFTATSGVNMYSMIEQVLFNQGLKSFKISPSLKKRILENIQSESGNATTIVESALATQSTTYALDTDSSNGTVIDISDLSEKRVIKIDPNVIMIQGGMPTVTSTGLKIKLFPVFNFSPGDIIQLDNGLIDVSSGMNSADSVNTTFNTSYLDTNGCYIIQQIDYYFENRGDSFYFDISAFAVDKYKNLTGG